MIEIAGEVWSCDDSTHDARLPSVVNTRGAVKKLTLGHSQTVAFG